MLNTMEGTEKTNRSADIAALLLIVALVGLMIFLYAKAIAWWWVEWTGEGSYYAHGIFIPFFVALMVWRDRERLRRLPIMRSWWGLPLVLLASAIVLYAQRAESRVTLSTSFILYIVGASLLIFGKKITRVLLFPMLFVITLIPLLPDQTLGTIAFPIQMTSAKLAATSLNLIGFPAQRAGTQIKLESYSLDVELPCSGFKTLVGLLAFSAAFAYLVDAAKWKRWVLFLSAAPLSIIINGVRITLIGLVGEIFSPEAAHAFHDFSGVIVLVIGFIILFSMSHWLKCERFMGMELIESDKKRKSKEGGSPPDDAPEKTRIEEMDKIYGPPRRVAMRLMTAGLVPLIFITALACTARAFIHPPAAALPTIQSDEVPASLANGEWNQLGPARQADDYVKANLQPETWIDRDYTRSNNRVGFINLLINGGMSRHTFHDPHDCFPAVGFGFKDVGVETIQTPVGSLNVQVSEASDTASDSKFLLMYVFIKDGKQITDGKAFQRIIIWDSLFGDSRLPSYFIRFRQYVPGNNEQRYDELRSFIKAVWTVIGPSIMTGEHVASKEGEHK